VFPNAAAFVETDHGPATPTALRQRATSGIEGHATEAGSVTSGFSSVAQAVLDHTSHPRPLSRSPTLAMRSIKRASVWSMR
jgi:hypothetical protein